MRYGQLFGCLTLRVSVLFAVMAILEFNYRPVDCDLNIINKNNKHSRVFASDTDARELSAKFNDKSHDRRDDNSAKMSPMKREKRQDEQYVHHPSQDKKQLRFLAQQKAAGQQMVNFRNSLTVLNDENGRDESRRTSSRNNQNGRDKQRLKQSAAATSTTKPPSDLIYPGAGGHAANYHRVDASLARWHQQHNQQHLSLLQSDDQLSQQQQQGNSLDSSEQPARSYNNDLNNLYFDLALTPRRVQTHLGETAYLMCRLRSYQQHRESSGIIVSWIKQDTHEILTSGDLRQTSDDRFKPTHLAGSLDWVLEIHNVNELDQGPFECQVNSDPKPAKLSIQLETFKAQLEIMENLKPLELDEGDSLRLTCRLEFLRQPAPPATPPIDAAPQQKQDSSPSTNLNDGTSMAIDAPKADRLIRTPPTTKLHAKSLDSELDDSGLLESGLGASKMHIYWYRDDLDLQFNNHRKGIQFEKWHVWNKHAKFIESMITISDVNRNDSGLYTCKVVPQLQGVLPAQTNVSIRFSSLPANSFFGWTLPISSSFSHRPVGSKLLLIINIIMTAIISSSAI